MNERRLYRCPYYVISELGVAVTLQDSESPVSNSLSQCRHYCCGDSDVMGSSVFYVEGLFTPEDIGELVRCPYCVSSVCYCFGSGDEVSGLNCNNKQRLFSFVICVMVFSP